MCPRLFGCLCYHSFQSADREREAQKRSRRAISSESFPSPIPTLQLSAMLHVTPCSQDPGLTGSLDVLGSFLIKGPAYVSFDDLDGDRLC